MPEYRDKMAVIGAGPVGLGMAKGLKDHSIPYDQLEADTDIGGNWYHGVYSTTHTISSRKVTQYPEYPMPAHYPDYPSRHQVMDYLRDYVQHFALRDHIIFNAKVVMARPTADQLWEVTLASGETRVYKGVVVSMATTGADAFPTIPGSFTGEYIHSKDYKPKPGTTGRASRAGHRRR